MRRRLSVFFFSSLSKWKMQNFSTQRYANGRRGCAQLLIGVCADPKCAYTKAGLATRRRQSLLISASWCRSTRPQTAVPQRHPVAKRRNCTALYKTALRGTPPISLKILTFFLPSRKVLHYIISRCPCSSRFLLSQVAPQLIYFSSTTMTETSNMPNVVRNLAIVHQ